jgi:hypothetical protein
MELEGLLPYSQEPVTGLYPEPDKYNLHLPAGAGIAQVI